MPPLRRTVTTAAETQPVRPNSCGCERAVAVDNRDNQLDFACFRSIRSLVGARQQPIELSPRIDEPVASRSELTLGPGSGLPTCARRQRALPIRSPSSSHQFQRRSRCVISNAERPSEVPFWLTSAE